MIDSFQEGFAIFLAGIWAGTINSIVGSGTLVTFPVLVWSGLPPVLANASSAVGLVPGSLTAGLANRKYLPADKRLLWRLLGLVSMGAVLGVWLLLTLPATVFEAVVPALIALGCGLVIFGPKLKSKFSASELSTNPGWLSWVAIFCLGVYGGYFGAGFGIVMMGVLAVSMPGSVHTHNAIKNFAAGSLNAVGALLFIFLGKVFWPAVVLIAAGAVLGAKLGAKFSDRISENFLRGIILVVGFSAILTFLIR